MDFIEKINKLIIYIVFIIFYIIKINYYLKKNKLIIYLLFMVFLKFEIKFFFIYYFFKIGRLINFYWSFKKESVKKYQNKTFLFYWCVSSIIILYKK